MKWLPLLCTLIPVAGCNTAPVKVTETASKRGSARTMQDSVKLYEDSEMRAICMRFHADPKDGLLNVVPNGKTKPIGTIFKLLGIDIKRLKKPTVAQLDFVYYHTWRVSPGYELSVMVAMDPDGREGYGVRLRRLQSK